jgi:MoxR-like ATPase
MENFTDTEYAGITRALGIEGWEHLDPVLLAALATEAPLLLVGPHGTAKSKLVELIADALGLSMRHYNASLLNYDDLVGIPMPDESGRSLTFIHTAGSIWNAEFVFFDEISRCRADLQNKMFPIVHERGIAGMKLEHLKHRWAAMNPPAPEDPEVNSGMDTYYGSEPLDPALADRFWFIVRVPNWPDLPSQARSDILGSALDKMAGDSPTPPNYDLVANYVRQCSELKTILAREMKEWVIDYITNAMDLLEKAQIRQSIRRAANLVESLVAIHAARSVLLGDEADLETSALTLLQHCLPQNCTEVPPSSTTIVTIHQQAWAISGLPPDDPRRRVLEEFDPARRVLMAHQYGLEDDYLSQLITGALRDCPTDPRRIGLAAVLFLFFRDKRQLAPSVWEPLFNLANGVLEARAYSTTLRAGVMTDVWNEIVNWQLPVDEITNLRRCLERNFVFNGFPDLWQRFQWREELEYFREHCNMFGITEEDTRS